MRTPRKLLGWVLPAVVALTVLAPTAPASAAAKLEAELTAAAEVPGPGDATAEGATKVTVSVKKQKVCYSIAVTDLSAPAEAAHIHKGDATVAGPVKVTLNTPTQVGAGNFQVSFGCEKGLRTRLLRNIKNDPANWYVNVHTADFPDGAVRGQLA
jgi:CHRD domain-containing protein